MRTLFRITIAALIVATAASCDAFHTLTKSKLQTAQGRPYELIVVCPQQAWEGQMGDTLRTIFTAPVPYLNQTEPLFDVLRVNERGYTGTIAAHRNILRIVVDPTVQQAQAGVQEDLTAQPQVVVTVQGPTDQAVIGYLSEHRAELVQVFEQAERDRAVHNNLLFNAPDVQGAIKRVFGIDMNVPKGYILAKEEKDFIWARFEYPTASQGFFVYSYPYLGTESLSPGALLAARNKFAARIPGPADGSYMITSDAFEPDFRMFRLNGRLWCELRGFWDVQGDFMGGPFVSYTTVDTATNRVITLDCYVFSPKLHKRNFLRGVEHLFYGIKFPPEEKPAN